LLVVGEVVETAVEAGEFGYVLVAIQQDVHGGLGKPFLMDIQLAPGI